MVFFLSEKRKVKSGATSVFQSLEIFPVHLAEDSCDTFHFTLFTFHYLCHETG